MTEPLVVVDHVSVTFGEVTVLDNVSMAVHHGDTIGVIGPSGAGKSTLLGLMSGLVVPAVGSVVFAGAPIRDDDAWRRDVGRHIATVPQQLHLTGPLRVVHNVNAGRLGEWSTARALWSLVSPREVGAAREALEAVGIADKLFARTNQLSGGEQQRVAIARALRQSPQLLLADEPTASLDPARALEVMELLAQLAGRTRCALVVSQHNLALAQQICRRLIGLRHGVVAFDRPSAEVTSDDVVALYSLTART
jgi:phosphonate transport system ATP-binding protein